MKILGIETSGQRFSLCLCDDEKLLYEIRKDRLLSENTRDAHLFTEVQRILGYLGKEKLGAIAISIGPGMFTSLRVGLSLAKGLGMSRKTPLFAINTLDTIGMTVPLAKKDPSDDKECEVCPDSYCADHFQKMPIVAVINAHQNEVYAAVYVAGRRASAYLLNTPALVKAAAGQFCSRGPGRSAVMFAGPGANLMKATINDGAPGDICFCITEADAFMPSGFKVIMLALPRIRSNDIDDPKALAPFYLKRTDAERNMKQ